jgi:hypothetical protein
MSRMLDIVKSLSRNWLGLEIERSGRPVMSSGQARRFLYFTKRYFETRHLDGNIVEVGVARGQGIAAWLFLVLNSADEKKIFGFDTFSGFPHFDKDKDGDLDKINKGVGYLANSQASVWNYLFRTGIPEKTCRQYVEFVEGDVLNTIPEKVATIGNISILHIDLDLYAGYKATLENLYDSVLPSGIIMFDEWDFEPVYKGPAAAIKEFLGEKSADVQHDKLANKYYFVKPE